MLNILLILSGSGGEFLVNTVFDLLASALRNFVLSLLFQWFAFPLFHDIAVGGDMLSHEPNMEEDQVSYGHHDHSINNCAEDNDCESGSVAGLNTKYLELKVKGKLCYVWEGLGDKSVFVLIHDVLENHYLEDKHADRVNHDENNQDEELAVVVVPNAVIEPLAVVVEFLCAPVTAIAVLGPYIDMRVTDGAVVVKELHFEGQAKQLLIMDAYFLISHSLSSCTVGSVGS